MQHIYLDNAASTKPHPQVLKTIDDAQQYYGNPSSIYSMGKKASELIENSRQIIADYINAQPQEIVFTGGGTEANSLAITGYVRANNKNGRHIISQPTEHASVLNTMRYLQRNGYDITYLPVDKNELINLRQLENAICDDTILISIMFANNETGVLQPVYDIGRIAQKYGICFHTDAVQALGHCDIDVDKLGISLMSMSAHKIYAPKGVGALYVREGIKLEPLFHGAGQEFGLRSGTENVQGITGMGKAVELIKSGIMRNNYQALKNRLADGILSVIPDTWINSSATNSLHNIVNIGFKDVDNETLITMLSAKGVYISAGSACMSTHTEPSHVLTAMGLPVNLAHNSVRFSFGIYNTMDEINYVLNILQEIIFNIRKVKL